MVIDRTNQACGYVLDDLFIPFDAPSCLLKSYDTLRKDGLKLPDAIYFADYISSSFHHADSTVFILTSHVPTVMNSGVLCFGTIENARTILKHSDERILSWSDYQIERGEPDRRENAVITPDGMQPDTIELNKGDLVELKLAGKNLQGVVTLVIKGYDDVGEIGIPGPGEQTTIRFRATRPGAGFPVIDISNSEPVGMIKVTGAHTPDEEEQ